MPQHDKKFARTRRGSGISATCFIVINHSACLLQLLRRDKWHRALILSFLADFNSRHPLLETSMRGICVGGASLNGQGMIGDLRGGCSVDPFFESNTT